MHSLALWLGMVAEPESPLPAILPRAPIQWEADFSGESRSHTPWDGDITPRVHVGSRSASDVGIRREDDRQKTRTKLQVPGAAITSQLSVRDPEWVKDDPLRRGMGWATDETVQVPLTDTLFVFGSMDAESRSVEQQQLTWLGRTGVGLRFRPWFFDEVVQLRTGPAMRYEDSDLPTRTPASERSELFIELTTKLPVPVLGAVNLEYTGAAIPPVSAAERERINQNLRFALPLANASQFHVGARWWNEDQPVPTPFIDRAQLYFGVQIRR